MCSVMNENGQNNKGLIITNKSIDLVEILDEGIELQVKDHHLLTLRMMITDHPHQEAPDPEDMSTPDVIGQGPVGARDLNVEGEAHLKRRGGHDPKEERVSIDHPKIEEGGIPPLHHKSKKLKGMRKTGISPSLPSQPKQRQWNLRIRHHYRHQILSQQQPRPLQLKKCRWLLHDRQPPNQFKGRLPRQCPQ